MAAIQTGVCAAMLLAHAVSGLPTRTDRDVVGFRTDADTLRLFEHPDRNSHVHPLSRTDDATEVISAHVDESSAGEPFAAQGFKRVARAADTFEYGACWLTAHPVHVLVQSCPLCQKHSSRRFCSDCADTLSAPAVVTGTNQPLPHTTPPMCLQRRPT